jgi:glycosyltransferase involved in cell wall biosynthesis
MIRPGDTGHLVSRGDVAALGEAMVALLRDNKRRRDLARNCRGVAEREFRSELQVERFLALYEKMLSGHRTRA